MSARQVSGRTVAATTRTPANAWDRVLRAIETTVNTHSFGTWLKPTELLADDGRSLTVQVPTRLFAEWLRTNYMPLIDSALRDMNRPGVVVEFRARDEDERDGTTAAGPPPKAPRPDDAVRPALNPRYTFESFVVSRCNDFAHAAATAVADKPSHAYNPLFIYGGVGLGKTHLMQAIGDRLAREGQLRLQYISTEHFMNELISAIRLEKTWEFKQKYRSVDVLLIDDIQFLAGKDRTQEEFFHTFNALYDAQKQIVITSDCPPTEIPTLEERLRSRFQWGLIADVKPPDLETKVAILQKKAEAEGMVLPDDVALFIASNTRSNIRELEGSLIRLIAYGSKIEQEITLQVAKDALRDLILAESPAVTVEAIQKQVSNHFNLRISELKSENKSPQISFPRQVAMYLCKQLTNCSLPEIGRRFGGKHHTTVLHAIGRIEQKRNADREFDRLMDGFVQQIR